MDAIFAGTCNAAELIGASKDIGSVQAGRYADIVAVDGDPLADITTPAARRLRDEGRRWG